MPFGTPPLGFSPSGGAPRSRGSKKKRCKSVAATTAASTTASAEREDAPTTGSTNKTAPEALPGPTVGGTEFAITRPGEGSIKTTSRGAAVFLVGEVECVLMTCTMCRCTFVSVLDGVPCCNRVDCVRATREMDWMRYKLGLGATHLPSAPWSARAAACTTSSKALLPARATTPTTTTQTVDKVAGPAAFVGTSPTPGEAEDMAAPSVIKAPTFSLSAATPPRRPDSRRRVDDSSGAAGGRDAQYESRAYSPRYHRSRKLIYIITQGARRLVVQESRARRRGGAALGLGRRGGLAPGEPRLGAVPRRERANVRVAEARPLARGPRGEPSRGELAPPVPCVLGAGDVELQLGVRLVFHAKLHAAFAGRIDRPLPLALREVPAPHFETAHGAPPLGRVEPSSPRPRPASTWDVKALKNPPPTPGLNSS